MNNLLNAAIEYKQAGLSVIPVNDKKKSLYYWRKYQQGIMTDKLLIRTFSNPAVTGIAIVCGGISGNLEGIDTDCRNDLTNTLFEQFYDALNNTIPDVVTRLVIAVTKNNGYHFYYRCIEIENNQVLAKRPCTDTEKMNSPHEKIKVLVETRATGGYIIVPPTTGYRFIQHDFKNIPVIEPAQRQILLNIARTFNQYQESISIVSYPDMVCADPESPFTDYDSRGDIIGLLERHGWKVVRRTPIRTYFRRPGKTDHDTSGDYNHQIGMFGVFSTSTEFETGRGYRPYAVYTILECEGNFRLAAKQLLEQGYGIPYHERINK